MEYRSELIEQYLNGMLTPAEKAAVEHKMANEPEFRQEVELHRQLHEEFADAGKLRLRRVLDDIMQEPHSVRPARKSLWVVGGSIVVLLLVLWGMFEWKRQVTLPAPQQQVPPPSPSIKTNDRSQPAVVPPPPAMALNRSFVPNPTFERRLHDSVRGEQPKAVIASPAAGASFPVENDAALILFEGVYEATGDQNGLLLSIYSNINAETPLLELTPALGSNHRFSTNYRLPLKPGLYYYTLESSNGEIVFIGKFKVGRPH